MTGDAGSQDRGCAGAAGAEHVRASSEERADTDVPTGRGQVRMATGPTRYLLIGAGSVCVALGALGVVLPLLPTTPFLLLAAACYMRSSPRFHAWLLGHRVLGAYIRDYLSGQGIPAGAKAFTIGLLWLTIGFSAIVVVEMTAIRILLLVIAVGVTTHLLMIRTARR